MYTPTELTSSGAQNTSFERHRLRIERDRAIGVKCCKPNGSFFLFVRSVRARSTTLLSDFVAHRCEPTVHASASPRRLSEPCFIAYGALLPLRLSSEIVAAKLQRLIRDVSGRFSHVFDFRFSISPRPLRGRNPESKIEILFDFRLGQVPRPTLIQAVGFFACSG